MRDLEYSLMNKFEGPVKVICGSNSEYMTKDLVHFFHRPFSNFEESRDLVWIEGANHWVHFTQPTKFLFQVNSFLKKFANC
jgi:pimeloyl-ACP methyl ester carboxylesterase